MKMKFTAQCLLLLSPLMLSQANAMTPLTKLKLEERKARSHQHVGQRQLKTNAKGTIFDSQNYVNSSQYRYSGNIGDWFNLDPDQDGVQGVSVNRVYQQFSQPTNSEDIIVAVIDSGVDVNHEDLRGKIWINTKEIPNNGIDDDGNGYVDDVFGWNFIGNKNGMAQIEYANNENGLELIPGDSSLQVNSDTLSITRVYAHLLNKKQELEAQGLELSASDLVLLKTAEDEVKQKRTEALDSLSFYEDNINLYKTSAKILSDEAGITEINEEVLENLNATTETLALAKKNLLDLLNRGLSLDYMHDELKHYDIVANYYYNPKRDTRAEIVQDNYQDINDRFYGNNDVIGPDSFHGTHVAGIIAANRDNEVGIKGIAQKVKIMAIRCVPDGDERSKDVANSIRYAVDNGAKIINMSFGKDHALYNQAVIEAIKYAEAKNILLIHAAGNSYKNNDTTTGYPNRFLEDREARNWIAVGATSMHAKSSFAASFSNYGKKTVDIFAPGVNILSTVPDNKYDSASGTSMATPVVAGVAALALSFDPTLSGIELKDIIINTTNRYPKLYVFKARVGQVLFSDLSIYGGVPNAYRAVETVIEKREKKLQAKKPRTRRGLRLKE